MSGIEWLLIFLLVAWFHVSRWLVRLVVVLVLALAAKKAKGGGRNG